MGHGVSRKKRSIKHMFLSQMQKEVQRLQTENKAMKEDPRGVIGQFIGDFNEIIAENQRLSALACALITQAGGAARVTREEIEVFKGKRLQVKINAEEEGVELKDASVYLFKFEATDPPKEGEQPAAEQPAVEQSISGATPPCADEACQRPKEPLHYHIHGKVFVATDGKLTETCSDPACTLPQDFVHTH